VKPQQGSATKDPSLSEPPSVTTPDQPARGLPIVAIVGPTASGKSALAIELARRFAGEVVNYDSVQVYRGFEIGSGKLRPAERQGVPHHLLDIVDGGQVFTAGDYRREAVAVIVSLRERGRLPILVGGTGLYLRALLQGLFDGPQRSETLRARLRGIVDRRGGAFLHRILRRLDPATAARIHPNDTQKVLRAVEVCLLAKEPMSRLLARSHVDAGRCAAVVGHDAQSGRVGQAGLPGYDAIKIGLDPDRAALYRRINVRVESMFRGGLVDEVRTALLRRSGGGSDPRYATLGGEGGGSGGQAASAVGVGVEKPLEALGYRQACALLRGEVTMEDAVRDTQTATRQYAKRQMTWFRRENAVAWFRGFGDDPDLQRQVVGWLGARLESPLVFSSQFSVPGGRESSRRSE